MSIEQIPAHLSIRQVAEYWGVSDRTVRRYIADGTISAARIGPKLVRIDRAQVESLDKVIPAGGFDGAA